MKHDLSVLPSIDELNRLFSYDPDTGVITRKVSVKWARAGAVAGSLNHGYCRIEIKGVPHQAHRIAWAVFHGTWPPSSIDHINGKTDDNRIENLRIANHCENMRNRKKPTNNTSGVKGVSWHRRGQKWTAQIGINNRIIYLGRFDNIEAAAASYARASEMHHKEFGRLG